MTDQIHQGIRNVIDSNRDRFLKVSQEIWNDPELGFDEHRAVQRLTQPLAEAGFEVEVGVAGLDTAFRATWDSGRAGPTIALLCEYDALKGLGHACGHNLIGTGWMLAGWAVRQAWPDLPGRVQVIGTPAEEGGGGKVYMVDRGAFEGVDAAIMFHPSSGISKVHRGGLSAQRMFVEYTGAPAHAAAAPWDGINALDAMIQLFVSIGLLRQQLRPDARIHGVITHGGDAANIIPEYTRAEFSVRAELLSYLNVVRARFTAAAEAAATATGTQVKVTEGPLYANRINNMAMARRFEKHLNDLGLETEEPDPNAGVGSSDIGNVSMVTPAIHPYVSISEEKLAGHTAAFREASNSPLGYDRMFIAATAMAQLAADLIADPELLAQAKAEQQAAVAALG